MRFFKPVALFAATISLCSVVRAEPLITAFIGTKTATSKTAFFVLDFNDSGANPETYNFGWNYEGTKTGADFPVALASALSGANGFTETHTDYSFGRFYNALGYNGRQISSIVNPAGYWNLWLGFSGSDWSSANVGVSDIALGNTAVYDTGNNLVSASWIGFRWVPQYVPGVTPPAPRTAQVAVVPEAGTLALVAGGAIVVGLVRRRKTKR